MDGDVDFSSTLLTIAHSQAPENGAAKVSKNVAMFCNPNPKAATEKKQIPMACSILLSNFASRFAPHLRLPL
jgi:hypothetical protein